MFSFVKEAVSALIARLRSLPPALLAIVALVVLSGALVLAWEPLSRQAERVSALLRTSDLRALSLAVAAAALAVVCTGLAWVTAARSLGSRATLRTGLARYGAACLAPPKLGNPSRIVLLARTIPGPRPVWAMTGVCGGISLARVLPLAVLVLIAAVRGWLSIWPALALVLGAVALLAAAPQLDGRLRGARVQRLLSGLALLVRSRRTATLCLTWLSLATIGKVMTATAAGSALGLRDPLGEALLLVPALAFGRTLPFLGFAAGALALKAGGGDLGVGHAVSVVFAVSAVEGLAAICCGILAATQLVRIGHLRNWRGSLRSLLAVRSQGERLGGTGTHGVPSSAHSRSARMSRSA